MNPNRPNPPPQTKIGKDLCRALVYFQLQETQLVHGDNKDTNAEVEHSPVKQLVHGDLKDTSAVVEHSPVKNLVHGDIKDTNAVVLFGRFPLGFYLVSCPRELFHVQGGHCGNQIGAKIGDEHGIDLKGT